MWAAWSGVACLGEGVYHMWDVRVNDGGANLKRGVGIEKEQYSSPPPIFDAH